MEENKQMAENLFASLLQQSRPSSVHHSGSLLEELLKPRSADSNESSNGGGGGGGVEDYGRQGGDDEDGRFSKREMEDDYFTALGKKNSSMFSEMQKEALRPISLLSVASDDDGEEEVDGTVQKQTQPTSLLELLNKGGNGPTNLAFPIATFNHGFGPNVQSLDVDLNKLGPTRALELHSVATMKRNFKNYGGNLVAANGLYIAYIGKAGVRLIRQSDGCFTLIKNHKSPIIDLALTPYECKESHKIISLASDGLLLIEKIIQNDEDSLSSQVLLKLRVSGAKNCIISKDGLHCLVLLPNSVLQIKMDKLQDCIEELDLDQAANLPYFIVHSTGNATPLAADYSPYDDSFTLALSDGIVRIVGGEQDGSSFALQRVNVSSVTVGSYLNDLVLIIGYNNNQILQIWDGDAFKLIQEIKFASRSESVFIKYFYHSSSGSLFFASSETPLLVRLAFGDNLLMKLTDDVYAIPGPLLGINAEEASLHDLDLLAVFENEISILSVVAETKGYVYDGDNTHGESGCECGHHLDVSKEPNNPNLHENLNNDLQDAIESAVAQELFNDILEEAIHDGAFELAIADTQHDSSKSSESAKEANLEAVRELHQALQQKYPEELRKHLPSEPVELKFHFDDSHQVEPIEQQEEEREDEETEITNKRGSLDLLSFFVEKKLESMHLEDVITDRIDKIVQYQVDKIIGLHIQAFSQHLDQNLPTVLESTLQGTIERSIEKSIGKVIEKQVSNAVEKAISKSISANSIKNAISSNLDDRLSHVINENFEQVLIPAYQASTQVMFTQMNNAFKQSLSGVMVDFKNVVGKTVDGSMKSQLSNQSEVLLKMSKQQDKQASLLKQIAESIQDVKMENTAPTTPLEDEEKVKISNLIENGEYETALTIAFESGREDLISHIVNKIDPRLIFQIRGLPLISQPAILALIQHVTYALHSNTEKRFQILEECMGALDMRHPLIAEYVRKIMPGVVDRLREWSGKMEAVDPGCLLLLSARLLSRFASNLFLQ